MRKILLIVFIPVLFFSCREEYKSFKEKYNYELLHKLLIIGRKSIMEEFKNKKYSHFIELKYSDTDIGVIFRIKKMGKERGCISFIRGVSSLEEAVRTAAINAAFFDSRFEPLEEEELNYLEVEAGIIGKFKEIKNKKNFKIGIDSLLLNDPLNRTFLQGKIAMEDKLSKTEFLNTLCKKAGLKEGSYKNENIKIFKAYTVYLKEKF